MCEAVPPHDVDSSPQSEPVGPLILKFPFDWPPASSAILITSHFPCRVFDFLQLSSNGAEPESGPSFYGCRPMAKVILMCCGAS